MDRRMFAGLFMIAAGAAAAGCGQASSQTGAPPAQEPLVVYDTPITRVVTDYEDFPGQTQAIYTVEVRARVSGYLNKVCFQDGQEVKRNDVLFEIDPRPFQATFDRQKAALEQAEAHAQRLNNEYHRAKTLYEQGRSISREEFDRYAFDYAEAQAALSTAQAILDLARLDLDWTKVRADLPDGVIGRLSRRMVDPGNLIKADDTMMTTIVSQDPLYVYFDVHEQAMLRIRRLLEEGKINASSEKEVTVLISLSDEKDSEGSAVFRHQGVVDFTDNRVDQNTGTLRFRAKISNPTHFITPGLFVKVRLPIGDPHSAILVREQSLQSDQGLKKVFLLLSKDDKGNQYYIDGKDEKGKAIQIPAFKPITVDVGELGVLRDRYREVKQGIKMGDLVVAQGMQKIRLGIDPVSKKPLLVKGRAWTSKDDLPGPAGTKKSGVPAQVTEVAAEKSFARTAPAATASPKAGAAAGSPKPGASNAPNPSARRSGRRSEPDRR